MTSHQTEVQNVIDNLKADAIYRSEVNLRGDVTWITENGQQWRLIKLTTFKTVLERIQSDGWTVEYTDVMTGLRRYKFYR